MFFLSVPRWFPTIRATCRVDYKDSFQKYDSQVYVLGLYRAHWRRNPGALNPKLSCANPLPTFKLHVQTPKPLNPYPEPETRQPYKSDEPYTLDPIETYIVTPLLTPYRQSECVCVPVSACVNPCTLTPKSQTLNPLLEPVETPSRNPYGSL